MGKSKAGGGGGGGGSALPVLTLEQFADSLIGAGGRQPLGAGVAGTKGNKAGAKGGGNGTLKSRL
jgi:hypothetical protein